jgi:hypothetical protein
MVHWAYLMPGYGGGLLAREKRKRELIREINRARQSLSPYLS